MTTLKDTERVFIVERTFQGKPIQAIEYAVDFNRAPLDDKARKVVWRAGKTATVKLPLRILKVTPL